MIDEALAADVRRWQAEGLWIDRGAWVTMCWSSGPAYLPTPEEIAQKCELLRSRPRRTGWHARGERASSSR